MFSSDIINSISTLIATVIALVSLVWSIHVNRILIKKNSDRIKLSIMAKAGLFNQSGFHEGGEDFIAIIIRFISPLKRKTKITHVSYTVYDTRVDYYKMKILRRVPVLRNFFKEKRFVPTELLRSSLPSLFLNEVVDLEDGEHAIFSREIKKLTKELKIKKKNIVEFHFDATPDHYEKICINAKELL